MKFSIEQLLVLSELYNSVPLRTPSRIKVIYEFATSIGCLNKNAEYAENADTVKDVLIDLHDEDCFEQSTFELSMENLVRLAQNLPRIKDSLLKLENASLFPSVVLPSKFLCCGKTISIKSEYASLMLVNLQSVATLRSYHGNCKHCKTVYYHGFEEKVNGERIFIPRDQLKVLIFNSGIAYSYEFLKYMDSLICIGAVPFERAASIYNFNVKLGNMENALNDDRLETAWFIYRILEFVVVFKTWPRKKKCRALDVEILAKNVYPAIKDVVNKKWLDHICDEIGCKNRTIVVDGNEKLYRSVCSADKRHIIGSIGEVNRYDLCINNPARGNQFCKSDKYCAIHSKEKDGRTEEQLDLRRHTRLFTKNIPTIVTIDDGCKKITAVDRFFNRTAGMFYTFRPCGIRLAHTEMYTCESLSDVFVHLIDTFGKSPLEKDIKGVVYDRACDLHPFIQRLSSEGNECAKAFEKLDYIVDSFHVEGHTQNKCRIDSPECKYHPKLERFKQYTGMNSEIAEQSFCRLNGYKYSTRKMTYSKRLLFFKFLDDTVNNILQSKIDNNCLSSM